MAGHFDLEPVVSGNKPIQGGLIYLLSFPLSFALKVSPPTFSKTTMALET